MPRSSSVRAIPILLLGVLCGCHTLLRYKPVEPGRAPAPVAEVAGTLSPYVLTGLASKRLVVEVDWIAGNEPSAYALDGLRAMLARYVSAGREVRVEKGEEIPADEWPAGLREDRTREVLDRHLTHDPGGADQVVYILYVPRFHGYFGFASEWPVTRGGRTTLVSGCVVCMEAARKQAFLWIGARKIERATLVHEFGHVLGLVKNPRHEQADDPVHCTHTECLMAHPRPRTVAANFLRGFFTGRLPGDYCRACRGDIRDAQAHWAAQLAADPRYGERLLARQRARDLTWMADEAARGTAEGTAPDPARAEALYREALALDAQADGARFQLARALVGRGQVDEAVALGRDASTSGSLDDARARIHLALELCALGRYSDAETLLDAATRGRLSARGENWVTLAHAWALSGQGRFGDAASALAAYRGPTRAYAMEEAFMNGQAAVAYRRAGDLDRAAALADALRASSLVELGRVALARGDAEGARARFLDAAAEARVEARRRGIRGGRTVVRTDAGERRGRRRRTGCPLKRGADFVVRGSASVRGAPIWTLTPMHERLRLGLMRGIAGAASAPRACIHAVLSNAAARVQLRGNGEARMHVYGTLMSR